MLRRQTTAAMLASVTLVVGRYMRGDASTLSGGSCTAHFATPCAIQTAIQLVDEVADALSAASAEREAEVLANVSAAQLAPTGFNREYDFWPSVFNESGAYVACGRPASALDVRGGSELVGQELQSVAAEEAGIDQAGLWERVRDAAAGDGYFVHAALDRYAGHSNAGSNAVTRVGRVREVSTASYGRLFVVSSWSDTPLAELAATQPCDDGYDEPCSIAYARKVLGRLVTSAISAATEAKLQQEFLAVTRRHHNDHGFYPFIYTINGTCVAHGVNSAFFGRRLQDIVDGAPKLQGLVDGTELHDVFVQTAASGGGWVGCALMGPAQPSTRSSAPARDIPLTTAAALQRTDWWKNVEGEAPYLKISLISGVSRFGQQYYMGVGFNHQRSPVMKGPHCATCKQNYNTPCAWTNAKRLIGHSQSLVFMSNRHSVAEAFDMLSQNQSYGGGGSADRALESSSNWLYPFVYDFNGTCVAHGANPSNVGRTLWDIISANTALSQVVDGHELHEKFVTAARGEGRWVSYEWWNSGDEATYLKLAYIVRITREDNNYYLGVGLADHDWTVRGRELSAQGGGTSRWMWGCSVEEQHPCSEDWAMTVAGRSMSAMLKAATNAELLDSLRSGARNDTFGFETHVHSSSTQTVLWDGHDPTFIGQGVSEWLRAVGLYPNDLPTRDYAGQWLKRLDMRLTRDGPVAKRYLFFISVPIEDELADGVADGVGDTFNVLVAVSGATPMKTAARSSEAGWAYECLQRPSIRLAQTSDGEPDSSAMASERIKCVGDLKSDPEHCSDVNEYGVCPNPLSWSSWSASTRDECVERVNEGRWANDTFCGCARNYNLRFANKRTLGQADDAADIPDDAQCSAIEHACQPGDTSCVHRLALQEEYEQFCLFRPPDAPCPIGTFGPGDGYCLPCPGHATTLDEGTLTSDGCVCKAGYYRASSTTSAVHCKPCSPLAICLLDATVATLELKPGTWRLSNRTEDLKACKCEGQRCATETYRPCQCTGTNYGMAEARGFNEPWGADTYGSSCAAAWDSGEAYCMAGGDSENAPWCPDKWCYVDSHCPGARPTDYFRGTEYDGKLFYSYEHCGVIDTFVRSENDSFVVNTPCFGWSAVGSYGVGSCRLGHIGPRCEACNAADKWFDPTTARCEQCPGAVDVVLVLASPLLAVIAIFLIIFVWNFFADRIPRLNHLRELLQRATTFFVLVADDVHLVPLCKILVGFYQIVAVLDTVYDTTLPPEYRYWLRYITFDLSYYWDWLVPGVCVPGGVTARLCVMSLWPFALIMVLLGAMRMHHKLAQHAAISRGMGGGDLSVSHVVLMVSLPVIFCLINPISRFILRSIDDCEGFGFDDFDDSRKAQRFFLRLDPRVECRSDEHYNPILIAAWIFVVIWPIGFPLLFISLLLRTLDGKRMWPSCLGAVRRCADQIWANLAKEKSDGEKSDGKHAVNLELLDRALRFLTREYKQPFFLWEVVDMTRKLTLVAGVLHISATRKIARLMVALIVSALFLVLTLFCRPYRERLPFILSAVSQLILVCIFAAALSLKMCEPMDDMATVMVTGSDCQWSFGMDSSQMMDRLFGICVCMFAVIVIVLSVGLFHEKRRWAERYAARAAKVADQAELDDKVRDFGNVIEEFRYVLDEFGPVLHDREQDVCELGGRWCWIGRAEQILKNRLRSLDEQIVKLQERLDEVCEQKWCGQQEALVEWCEKQIEEGKRFRDVYDMAWAAIKNKEGLDMKAYERVAGKLRDSIAGKLRDSIGLGLRRLIGSKKVVTVEEEAGRRKRGELHEQCLHSFLDEGGQLATLYEKAVEIRPAARAVMEGLSKHTNAVLEKLGPLKRMSRAVEKIVLQPKDSNAQRPGPSKICDIVRDMFVCETMDDAAEVLHALANSPKIQIVRFKDRFFSPSDSGWRDAMINYRLNGYTHICEVQIVHKKLLMCRDKEGLGGHHGYAKERNAREILEFLRKDAPGDKSCVELQKEMKEKLTSVRTGSRFRQGLSQLARQREREDVGVAHKFSEALGYLREQRIWTVARNKDKLVRWRGCSTNARVQDAKVQGEQSHRSGPGAKR